MSAARLLIIDDEAQITRVLRASLSAQGYQVRTANDPEEGLQLYREWSPDLDEAALQATRGEYFENAESLEARRRKDVGMNTEVRRVKEEPKKLRKKSRR